MSKWLKPCVLAAALALVCSLGWAQEKPAGGPASAKPPLITIGLQVATAQGQPRTFDRPGLPPAAWNPTFPVVQGDTVLLHATVDPKEGKLGAVRLRLDNEVLLDQPAGPWNVSVKTADLKTGHHLVEVWAELKDGRFRSASTSFLVVPQDDPLLRVLLPEYLEASRARLPQTTEARLVCQLSSANRAVAQALAKSQPAPIEGSTLLEVKAKAPVTRYVYTLSRSGKITYISPSIELATYIEITPRGTDAPEGLAQGEVELTVWAGDAAGRFGPPARALLLIK